MKTKIIDEKGRLFGKISVIDLVVILVAIVIVIAAYLKFNVREATAVSVKTVPVTYEVIVRGVRWDGPELIRSGDLAYTDSGLYMGQIVSVAAEPATSASSLMDGSYEIVSVENRKDVRVTLEAQCSVSDGRYYVDRTFELNVNSEVKMQTKYQSVTGIITQISDANG